MEIITKPTCIVVLFLISSIYGGGMDTRKPFGPRMCMELCRNALDVCLFKVESLTCYYADIGRREVDHTSNIKRKQSHQCSSFNNETAPSRLMQPSRPVCALVEFPPGTNYTTALNQAALIGDLCTVHNILSLGLLVSDIDRKQECGLAIVNAITHGHDSVFSVLANQGCNLSMVIAHKFTPLHLAVHHNRLQMVRILQEVDEGFDIERKEGGRPPLLIASREGHVQMFQLLTCMGANLTAIGDSGQNILLLASGTCHLEMVRHILSLDVVDIDYIAPTRDTAAMRAALYGCIGVVKILVNHGADLTLHNSFKNNILHCAVQSGNVKLIAYILDLGLFDMECKGFNGMTPLLQTSCLDSVEAFDFLIKKGGRLDATDTYGNNVLHLACGNGKLKLIKHIVGQRHIGIETKGSKGGTPIIFAAANGRVQVLKYLQSEKCNIMARDTEGNTAMHIAVTNDQHAKAMHYLLNIMSCEVTNNIGNTPILKAVMFNTVKTVDSMYTYGCKLTAINSYGFNALHLAATRNKHRILRYMLNTGVGLLEVDSRGGKGITALIVAARHGYFESFELLHQHGANINITDDNGQNILHVACGEGSFKMVKFILKKYYYFLERKDKMGRTPLLLAAQNARGTIVEYLVRVGCDLSAQTYRGDGLLHKACESRNLDFVKFVTSLKSLNFMQKNHMGLTPARQAHRRGALEIVKYLKQRGRQ